MIKRAAVLAALIALPAWAQRTSLGARIGDYRSDMLRQDIAQISGDAMGSVIGDASTASGPIFWFDPSNTNAPPSIDRLPSSLTINGVTVEPSFRYRGGDADATDWDAWTYGETLALQAGTAPTYDADTPLLGANDAAADFNAGGFYKAAGTSTGNITTGDIVFEAVIRATASTSSYALGKRSSISPNEGYHFYMSANAAALFIDAGASTATMVTGTLVTGAWYHVFGCINRDENSTSGAQLYINGAASGSGVNASASSATLTNANNLVIGADPFGANPFDERVAYTALYTYAGLIAAGAGGQTECASVAKDRFARLTAMHPRIARGTAVPTVMTRSTANTLRKCTSNVQTLFTVGANWPRVERLCDGTVGYLSEPALSNLALQSEDVATSWTEADAGDTQSLNAAAGLDGTTTADGNIADATDGDHGFSQAVTLTAATYTLSTFAKAGNKTWAYLSDDTVANATGYFNLSTCAAGTKGAGAAEIFVRDYGNGWCRIGISFTGTVAAHTVKVLSADADADKTVTGDAATVNTYLWGSQVELFATITSYIRTTTASVSRSADTLTYAPSGNAPAVTTTGSIVCAGVVPNFNNAANPTMMRLYVDASNSIALTQSSTDGPMMYSLSGGAALSTTGTGDASNGTVQTWASTWGGGNSYVYTDGVQVGTSALFVAPVGAYAEIRTGYGINVLGGNLSWCKIYNTTGKTR